MGLAEHRITSLEHILADFIDHTNASFQKLHQEVAGLKDEMQQDRLAQREEIKAFKEEMQAFRDEMQQDRLAQKEEMKAFKEEMQAFRDEMRQDRLAQKEEMKAFKEEMQQDRLAQEEKMQAFRDEMQQDRLAQKEEIQAFRNEMQQDRDAQKEEMQAFKEEMQHDRAAQKEEMQAFKIEILDLHNIVKSFREQQDAEWKKWRQEWSNLAKKMGTMVEDLIAPALGPVLSTHFQCNITMTGQRQYKKKNGRCFEIDAIAGSEDRIFMVEVRATPQVSYVDTLVEKRDDFFHFFPEHQGKKLDIIFAGIAFPDNVIEYASRKGIYIMAWREWEYMDILNYDQVQKRRYD